MTVETGTGNGWFDIDRTQLMAELQKLTANLSRTETAHGVGVNLVYLFLSKAQKQALVQIHYQQTARRILEELPQDASELRWFSSVVSSFLVQRNDTSISPLFEFLKKKKEQGEASFRAKIETYVQERAAQRFPDDAKADYAIADSIRYVAKTVVIEREQLEKIYYYLNHYHPAWVSLFTRATCAIKLLETPTHIVLRKIDALRHALTQFNEAKVNHDLEMRMLSLKRLKDAEVKAFIQLFDLLLYLGPHDPLHEVLEPIMQKIEQNFQNMTKDFQVLHQKNIAKSGEVTRRHTLEQEQHALVTWHNQLKEENSTLMLEKQNLEKETASFRKQKVTQDAINYLQQKINKLEKENMQLMDDYYFFKVKLLNVVPADSEQEQVLDAAWQEYLDQKKSKVSEDVALYEPQSFEGEQADTEDLSAHEVDEDLLDEPSKINLAEISPTALKILNNRLDVQNQKLDEINRGLEQQNRLIEQRLLKLNELKQRYFESKEFDVELEKQSLESHCNILLKDRKRNTMRLEEIEWKLEKLLEVYDGDKTEIKEALREIEKKHAAGEHHLHSEE